MFIPSYRKLTREEERDIIDLASGLGKKLLWARSQILLVQPEQEDEFWSAKKEYNSAYHALYVAVTYFQPGRFGVLEDMQDAGVIDFDTFVRMAVESVNYPPNAGPVDLPSF